MAKKLTSAKAKEILHDKSVHGHPLTDKQRRFFGAIAGGAKPYKAEEGGWLDKYEQGGLVLKQKTHDNFGKKANANNSDVSLPPGFKGLAYNTKGRNYSPAWGGQFQNGGVKSKIEPIQQTYIDNTYVKKPNIPVKTKIDYLREQRNVDEKTAKSFLNQYYNWASDSHPFYHDLSSLDSFDVKQSYSKKNQANIDRLNNEMSQPMDGRKYNNKFDSLMYYMGDNKYISNRTLKTRSEKELTDAYQQFRKQPLENLNRPDTLVFHKGFVRGEEGLLGEYSPIKNITDISEKDRLQTLIHERAHKADRSKRLTGVMNEGLGNFISLRNNDLSGDQYLDTEDLQYLRDFSERQARHRSTQFWLQNNMSGYNFKKPITEKEYDFLIKNQSKIPGDTKQLLNLYGDRENFIKYINRFQDGGNLMPAMAGAVQTVPMAQNGGLWNTDKTAWVDSIHNARKADLNFVKRFFDQSAGSIQIPGQRGTSTHFMESGDKRAYPTVVQMPNGKLQYLNQNDKNAAWNYAKRTGQFIQFPTDEQAKWYADNGYKKGTGVLKKHQMGGVLPGAVGFTYARVAGSAPANGKYTKKTKASAQNGKEMKFYQAGLDFKPKTISQDGSEIPVDPMGYWNPENIGNPVIIPSTDITMEGVDQPLIGISDTGDVQYMQPGEDYAFDGEYVTEYPVAKKGISVNMADQYPIEKLDQSLNFTNYNKPTKGGWLDKYN